MNLTYLLRWGQKPIVKASWERREAGSSYFRLRPGVMTCGVFRDNGGFCAVCF